MVQPMTVEELKSLWHLLTHFVFSDALDKSSEEWVKAVETRRQVEILVYRLDPNWKPV